MTRDLNQLMNDLRNSREVVVTTDGQVETLEEAEQNEATERATEGVPQGRLSLKQTLFGV